MVFSPYRLFCFLLLKQAGIPTLQVSFTCNQMAWHKKYSIYDSHRHKHTVSLPDLWCKVRRVFIRASLSEKLLHPTQNKSGTVSTHTAWCLFFANTDSTAAAWRFLYSNLCIESLRQCELIPIMQFYPKSCYIHEKQSGTVSTHTAWCLFFPNTDGTAATWRFLYPNLYIESLRQRQAYSESCYISRKTKAAGLPPIPLDVYLFPKQTARLPQGVFSTRICASNRSANADNSNLANPSGKLLHPRKAKRYSFHSCRLMFIFSNADGTTATWRFLYSNLCIELLRQCRQF